ncbi:MAG: hypothetical protein ABW022_23320, partial [Actinoplanes sp.]
ARGARPGLTWLAPLLALASEALALSVLVALEPPPTDVPPAPALLTIVFLAAFAGLVMSVPFGGCWLAGHLVRLRRQRRHDREEGAVAMAAAEAAWRARDERARIAAGLRVAVLEHAARVPAADEKEDLTGVVDSAREALAAMRGLLDGLGSEVTSSPSA